ncbi:MAG: Major Facilitator Superfamily protein [Mucilaginibacter sp.]|nr:Major Facilitator Superfamily protein [Mucilaginibacter sp.]
MIDYQCMFLYLLMRPAYPCQTAPYLIFFLVLPYGISSGFVSVTLPFLLVQHGFSVAATASITALGLSANLWRFAWAPLTDLTLSLHKWYLIGTALCAATLLLLCGILLQLSSAFILTVIVFLSQIAATLVVSPVGGFMAGTVHPEKKGLAAGWYQAGNVGGMGFGGGAGIWLSTHYSYQLAIIVLCLIMALCTLTLYVVAPVLADSSKKLTGRFKFLFTDLKSLMRSPSVIFSFLVIITPVGIGAAAYIWSSIGGDWHADADLVALVNGVLSAIITVLGCVFGGWVADKAGRWWSFFGAGSLMALIGAFMAFAGFNPFTYTVGILCYAFAFGCASAAFSAVALHAIGPDLGSTKYALISSFSNIAPVYMTALDGWVYGRSGIKVMLLTESLLGGIFVIISLLVLAWLNKKERFRHISTARMVSPRSASGHDLL